MSTVAIAFANGIDISKFTSLKVKIYVSSFTAKLLCKDYIRIYGDDTFANLGGVYDEWCEIDILPLLKEIVLVKDNV